MNLLVAILSGPLTNKTLSSVCYSQHGVATNQSYIVCNTFADGFAKAKKEGYDYVLLLDKGTCFYDWEEWMRLLIKYPNKGLVGHIVNKNNELYLDTQCTFVQTDQFEVSDFSESTHYPMPSYSVSTNIIHSDYTPLFITPGGEHLLKRTSRFGHGLISRQLSRGYGVVNWNNKIRQHKICLKNAHLEQVNQWVDRQNDYANIALSQLWVFNNEPIRQSSVDNAIMPAAGLFWILNIISDKVSKVQLCDISKNQIALAEYLWTDWDGIDFGAAVYEFIRIHKLQHIQFADPYIPKELKLKLKFKKFFIPYVNKIFDELVPDDFVQLWNQARASKHVTFTNTDLVEYVVSGYSNFDSIWLSNILDYKWTIYSNSLQRIHLFNQRLKELNTHII